MHESSAKRGFCLVGDYNSRTLGLLRLYKKNQIIIYKPRFCWIMYKEEGEHDGKAIVASLIRVAIEDSA